MIHELKPREEIQELELRLVETTEEYKKHIMEGRDTQAEVSYRECEFIARQYQDLHNLNRPFGGVRI